MTKSIEEIIRDRIVRLSGKEFQQFFWDILICHYPDLQTPKMQHDLGNDGYSIQEKTFFAVYAPELKYDNKETEKKISEDYSKFVRNWRIIYKFAKWIFVTRDNLMGTPHQKIVELNSISISDGIKKEQWGLEQIVKLAIDLEEKDRNRIFNLPGYFQSQNSQGNEVETIMDLICYITHNNHELKKKDFDNIMPDPDKKLERFAKYCQQIKNEIVNAAMYATSQKEAEQAIGLDKIMTAKIVGFLKQYSLRFLRENKNNPMNALDKLTDYFENELQKAKKNYDYSAIRYYLIAQIPKCNVFPNNNE